MDRGEDMRLSTLSGYPAALGYTGESAGVEAATGAVTGRLTRPVPPKVVS